MWLKSDWGESVFKTSVFKTFYSILKALNKNYKKVTKFNKLKCLYKEKADPYDLKYKNPDASLEENNSHRSCVISPNSSYTTLLSLISTDHPEPPIHSCSFTKNISDKRKKQKWQPVIFS